MKDKKGRIWKSIFRRSWPKNAKERTRVILDTVFLHIHPPVIKKHALKFTWTFGLGGITFLLFIILTVTGILLMFYYRPTAANAWEDIQRLRHDVPFGAFIRNMHRWAGHLMVITAWLHMLRVFMTGSYKHPREFNWVIGVFLLTATMLLAFTGYLLPFDQLAQAAGTVASHMASSTPFVGAQGPFGELLGFTEKNDIAYWLRGESSFGEITVLRAYVWHCIGLPLISLFLMVVHFWRIRKDGGISGPYDSSDEGGER